VLQIAQFIVLFAAPLGLLLLTLLVVVRWLLQSRRRERREPHLEVIPGEAGKREAEAAGPISEERPPLRIVGNGRPGGRRRE
jgi:hypothetical protein